MKQLLFYGASISIAIANAECPANEIFQPSSTEKYCIGSADAEEKDRCACKENKTRKFKGSNKCIPTANCSRFGRIFCARTGQIYKACMDCTQECGQPKRCMKYAEGMCPGGCVCPDGELWNDATNECVPEKQCPICPANSTFGCYATCESTCQNPKDSSCVFIKCDSRCECNKGFVKDETTGNCVPEKQCPAVCPANSHWNNCASSCIDTCQTPAGPCNKNAKKCQPRCQCDKDYIVDEESGECILESECPDPNPECPENESWNGCASPCAETCQTAAPEICMTSCEAKCECNEGLIRDEATNKCVPQKQCSTCPATKVWKKCDDCSQKCGEAMICHDLEQGAECPGGCACPENTVWDENKRECISFEECHNCPAEMTWNPCATGCVKTCQDMSPDDNECTKQCVPRCECSDPCMVINEIDGKCTNVKMCPQCPANEVWNSCAPAESCEETCQSDAGPCPKNNKICVPRCQCEEGFIRDEISGTCIQRDQCPICLPNQKWVECPTCTHICGEAEKCVQFLCPIGEKCSCPFKPKCQCLDGFQADPDDPSRCIPDSHCGICTKPNEVWKYCGTACETTCQNRFETDKMCTLQCVSKCFCDTGFIRDAETGMCVREAQCPAIECIGENEEWKLCSRKCEPSCDTPTPSCTKECQPPQCQCKNGYLRDSSNKCILETTCAKISDGCDDGYQKHTDGKCYAFLTTGKKVCDVTKAWPTMPFMSEIDNGRCKTEIKLNKTCKLKCKYDKKFRSTALPVVAKIRCVPAKDANGIKIGTELKYVTEYDTLSIMCGKGCNLEKISQPEFMGSTVEIVPTSTCSPNDNGLIPLSTKKCKVKCQTAKDATKYASPTKPLQCICTDNDDSTGRVCQWRFLDDNPAKLFDKKFIKAQADPDSNAKCSA